MQRITKLNIGRSGWEVWREKTTGVKIKVKRIDGPFEVETANNGVQFSNDGYVTIDDYGFPRLIHREPFEAHNECLGGIS